MYSFNLQPVNNYSNNINPSVEDSNSNSAEIQELENELFTINSSLENDQLSIENTQGQVQQVTTNELNTNDQVALANENIANSQVILTQAQNKLSIANNNLSQAHSIPGKEIINEDGTKTIDYSERDAAIAAAEAEVEAAEAEVEAAQVQINEAQEEYNTLVQQLSEYESEYQDLLNSIQELQNNIDNYNVQIADTQEQIEILSVQENENTQTDNDSEQYGNNFFETQPYLTNEEINEELLDEYSFQQLKELAAQYTDDEDLTPEEYGQILALNQINTNFNNMYSQYTDQLDSEGWIDDVYNALKDVTNLGITREMIQEDFDNYSGAMKSLKSLINKDKKAAKEETDKEFIRQVNEASTFKDTMEVFERYYGNEQDAVNAFNKYIDKNQDKIDFYGQGIYEDVRLSKIDEKYVFQIKFPENDGWDEEELTKDGYKNFEIADNDTSLPIPLQGLLVNGKIDIEKDKDILKKDIDFNSCYKFWTGVDYSQDNIDKYNDTLSVYSQANMGIAQAYNLEQSLKDADLNNAIDIFTDLYEGDKDAAIEAFNDYYAALIQENNSDVNTNQGNNKLTEVRAEKNENGEIEYVMRYEDSGLDDGFSDLYMFPGYNGKDNYYEIRYNPNSMDNVDSFYANTAFCEINSDIAKHNVIQERFNRNFEAQMGKSPQEAINEYFAAYETAFGNSEIQDTLNSYINDMDSYAQKLSSAISIGSIGLSFVCPAFGLVAMGSSFLDNGIDAVNMASNEKKGEDWQSLAASTAKEASFIMIGMGIGKFANSVNTSLSVKLLKNTQLSYKTITALGTGSEVLLDGGLGIGFDYLTTGDLNLSGNGLSVFLDIMSGVRGYKAFSSGKLNYVKGADGTLSSFSKDGFTEIKPQSDGSYKSFTYDINDRSVILSSDTLLKVGEGRQARFISINNLDGADTEISIPKDITSSKATKTMDIEPKTEVILKADSPELQDTIPYMSKANDVQAYRFDPTGTPEEILAKNPNVFMTTDGKYAIPNKWNPDEPYIIDATKEQMIMLYGGDDFAVCDGKIFHESYVETASFKESGALKYQNPETLEYGKIIDVTKQAPGSYKEVPVGTKVQTLEGVRTVGPNDVVAIDSSGNPYITPKSNILKRNIPIAGDAASETAFARLAQNIVTTTSAKTVGEEAAKILPDSKIRIATAGYSAAPEGYEEVTKAFLTALDEQLGHDTTAYVTSPNADKGSIDAITTEVAGLGEGRLFYTTAEDYVGYINPDNFPETIDRVSYSNTPKYVLPTAEEYSRATAEASNVFISTGGRNATVSDFVNAIEKGNKAIIINDTELSVPVWSTEKGRVENASAYIEAQLTAYRAGLELPYPEIGGMTKDFLDRNACRLDRYVKIYQVDGTESSISGTARKCAEFIKAPSIAQAPLEATSSIISSTKVSMISQASVVEAFVPDLSAPDSQLEALGLKKENGQWYLPNRKWFSNPLSENDILIIYKTDKNGIPTNMGMCAKSEFSRIYTDTQKYNAGTIEYINAESLPVGQKISATKCSSGEFLIMPVGTKLETNEGIVEVNPGEAVIINSEENSVYAAEISAVLSRYQEDPTNPASREMFALLRDYEAKKDGYTEAEKKIVHQNIADAFTRVNRTQKLFKIFGTESASLSLKEEYEMASKIVKDMDEKYFSKIDVSNFDSALEQARQVLQDINADDTLSPEQKQAAVTAVMVRLLPKTNSHQHLKGSLPFEITMDLAAQKGFKEQQMEAIKESYAKGEKGYDNLNDFTTSYGIIGSPVNTPDDYRQAIEGIMRDSIKQGQLTVEIRCATDSLRTLDGKGLSLDEGTETILSIIDEVSTKLKSEGLEPPKTGFVFLTYRGKDWDLSLDVAKQQAEKAVEMAVKYPNKKFGFDIAGPEDTGYGPKAFSDAISVIKTYNQKVAAGEINAETIGITMHAGETPTFDGGRPGYYSIEEAIEMGADRIGHGVQAVLSPETLVKMKEAGITVEICGVCNIQSIPINTEGLAQHPVQKFIDYDIPITIATDNDAICGTSISKEYMQFMLTGHGNIMNWNNLTKIVKDSLDSSFIPEADKKIVFEQAKARISQIQKLLVDYAY